MLSSVSLFGGAVTAHSVQASAGRGRVTELAIDGSVVAASGGETLAVDGWGQLTLGATVGRVTAPLVLRLIQARDGLPAGTVVVVAFGASARIVAKPAHQRPARGASGSARGKSRRSESGGRKPTPDFPTASNAFRLAGGLPKAVRKNPVVSLAMRYIGVRYQWGGATPATGFDCSGLVVYVFGKLGVSLPHFAASQYYSPGGVWVRPSRLEPGDLVFFTGSDGTRKEPGHVGIYVDDGYIIDAPHTGAFVRIDNLNDPRLANEYVGAKRITTRLLAARHLSHASKPDGSTAGLFPYPAAANGVAPLNEPLELVAAETHVIRPSLLAHWKWAGVALGGGILLLLGGALIVCRRRGLRLVPAWPFST
jgi:cell wall-associated NlpC family hydrolase